MSDENPQAFKHAIGAEMLQRLGAAVTRVWPQFRARELKSVAPKLQPLEMKDRIRLVRSELHALLPKDYEKAVAILVEVSRDETLRGFDLWPLADFVEAYGVEHFESSMAALYVMTQRFTGEFAVRPFLQKYPEKTFAQLRSWATDENHHVRRWVSEGTRPRLPWGQRVPALIADPRRGLELLEILRFDPELFVRKSVANHLNDISKDHPAIVIDVLTRWKREASAEDAPKVDWITRQALRTLIKKGDAGALALVGAGAKLQIRAHDLVVAKPKVRVGESLAFEVVLESTAKKPQKIVVDYVIHFVNARGGLSRKVFKLRTFTLGARAHTTLSRRHSLRPITTRVYYPGTHRLDIQVNGRVMLSEPWELVAAPFGTARRRR